MRIISVIIDNIKYYGIIYKITNTINNKVYIGQTTLPKGFFSRYHGNGTGIERVYNDYICKRNRGAQYNKYLLHSIEKYGLNAFTVDEVFDTASSKEELDMKEIYYIEKFDCIKNGYNSAIGGDSFKLGYTGKDCQNSKRVCQISLDGKLIKIWDCATNASRELGVTASSISNVCNRKKLREGGDVVKTAGGYVWVFEKDYDPDKDYAIHRPRQNMGHGCKTVLLLSNTGEILQEFYSINEASRETGIGVEGIRKTCLHKFKKPKHNFIYKSEYIEEQRLNVEDSAA